MLSRKAGKPFPKLRGLPRTADVPRVAYGEAPRPHTRARRPRRRPRNARRHACRTRRRRHTHARRISSRRLEHPGVGAAPGPAQARRGGHAARSGEQDRPRRQRHVARAEPTDDAVSGRDAGHATASRPDRRAGSRRATQGSGFRPAAPGAARPQDQPDDRQALRGPRRRASGAHAEPAADLLRTTLRRRATGLRSTPNCRCK